MDDTGAELLRLAANAVFLLPAEQVVVRVSAPGKQLARACRVVRIARWLEQVGFPAVQLHGDHDQPVVVGDYQATFWEYLPSVGAEPSPEELARLLRELHLLVAPFPLPRWDPVGDARQLLEAGSCLAGGDRAFLQERCDELEAELATLPVRLTAGVIHGDAWQGNLLMRAGAAVLCDLDQVSVGPCEWDLVPTVVNALRFGLTQEPVRRFLDAYGFDVMLWDGFAVLRKTRELVMLAGVVPVLPSAPGIASEFARRLDGLRNGREDKWTPYG